MNNLGLFEDELLALNATVLRCIPNPSLTIRLALASLLTGQESLAHAATVSAVAPGHSAAPMLGAALELMTISLHRLHEGLDRSSRQAFCLSTAGDILAGDYLSSNAFRLLVQVDSLPVMRMVSEAIQRACENEILWLDETDGEEDTYAMINAMISRRVAALGGAAGATAALLAGHDEYSRAEAGQFGHSIALASYWEKRMRSGTCPETIAIFRSFAGEALNKAEHAAVAFACGTGNELPLMLSERIRRQALFKCSANLKR